MFRATLEGFRAIVGDEHRSTLTLFSNLAFTLQQLEETEKLYRGVLDVQRRIFPNGNDYWQTMSSLAAVLCHLEKFDEAEALAIKSLAGRIEYLGENHRLSCIAMAVRDLVVWKWGRLSEAEGFARKTIEIKREHLGDKHQATVESMGHVGAVLTELDRLEEAEEMFKLIFELIPEVFVEGHWFFPKFETHYARCLTKLGRFEEAMEMLTAAHLELRELLAENHRHTVAARDAVKELETVRNHPADEVSASIVESGK